MSMPTVATVLDGLRWRYQSHIEPHVVVHRSPSVFLGRCLRNARARTVAAPVAYVCANPSNAGDYTSHLGVKQLLGVRGAELFCDPVAVNATMRTLRKGARPGVPWAAVIVGGGGLLQRAFDQFWERVLDLDVPLVLFGVGANEAQPFRRVTDSGLLARIARRAAALHVRDDFTRGLLAEQAAVPITVGICPSVNYIVGHAATRPATQTHLLHAVHDVDLQFGGADPSAVRAQLRRAARLLHLEYDEVDHVSGIDARLLNRYARAAVVISSRLHGVIFASAMRKPCMAIDCDRKMGAFLESHAPRTPRLNAPDAHAALTAERIAAVVDGFQPYDYRAAVAANRSRMNGIAALLGIPRQ